MKVGQARHTLPTPPLAGSTLIRMNHQVCRFVAVGVHLHMGRGKASASLDVA
jgi:hypothetical protein